MSKSILQIIQSCSVQKTAPKKTTKQSRNETILKTGYLARTIAHAKAIQPLQNGQFGSKIENPKNMRKTIPQEHYNSSVEKNSSKKTLKISEIKRFWKSAILQRLQPMQRLQPLENDQFGSKIKNAQSMRKTSLQEHQSCSVQKKRSEKKNQIFEK